MLSFSGMSDQNVISESKKIYQYLKKRVLGENIGIILYSPVPSPIDKIKNKYRYRIIIKCLYRDDINKLLQDMLSEMTPCTKSSSRPIWKWNKERR